ncbi:hydrogen peroxide-inducible genes activator [Shimia biformata]|uniref:hydrogen peroxide-inducible genes activator n=1 Tax=Shimia biformata TaxID=1294299 RepID=UPI001950AF3B|nr:hydrogen peroxide-inducible genes activator [Shimia biformata]
MIHFTLKQLRYVDALARIGHFGRAAEACAISQPALSMQIKELEESLGAALFERSARQVTLTALGERFVARARELLKSADEMADLARIAKGRLTGRLRLGIIPTIAPYLLPRIVTALTNSAPDLDVHVRETLTDRLVQELADGKLDLAIVALPLSEPWLEERPLFEENFLLVRPEADAEAPAPDAEGLREMKLLLLEEGHCFRDQALSFCAIRPSEPRESLDATSLSTLVQMVGAGIGVTLIPEMARRVETRSARVAVSSFSGSQPTRTVGVVWRKASPLAAQLTDLADTLAGAGLGQTP